MVNPALVFQHSRGLAIDYIYLSEAAGTTVTTDPSATGGKLDDLTATTITVHVVAPSCTAPAVTTDPGNESITSGSDASFTVAGTNYTGVQWQVSTDGGTIWNDLTGETALTLLLSKPTVSMSGYKYHAVLTGSCGSPATSAAATLTVGQATLTVTASSPADGLCGDAVPTITPSYNAFVLGEDEGDLTTAPICSTTYTQGDGPGDYATSCADGVSDNYAFTYVDGNFHVDKAPLTVTADNKAMFYGDPVPAFTFKYSGFVLGQDESVIYVAPTCAPYTPPYLPPYPVGTYPIKCSGGSDNNYDFTYVDCTLTVNAWTLKGFYQPVDMNGVLNVVKGGSTVPLKFEVFKGTTELTSTSVVESFVQTKIACDTSATIDEVEVTSTGGTSLRYDTTGGQFIQNWQTPKLPGACYRVTMTTQDGSTLIAFFKLK